jgi:hypothetical protein
MQILTEPALAAALAWLGDRLKFELKRQEWESYVQSFPDDEACGGTLYLFPSSWRMPATDDYVAFSFYWSNDSAGDPPCVQLYLPAEETFPQRNDLLDRISPQLRRAGFSGDYGDEDPDPSCPLWRNIQLEFGVDLPAILLAAVRKGFEDLIGVEKLIEEAVRSAPLAPPAWQRELKTLAFLDTEWTGQAPHRKMTELAFVIGIYDPVKDDLVYSPTEYSWLAKSGKLDKAKALALLNRAEKIIAHNFNGDRSLVEKELPGIDPTRWICSFRGVDWKNLIGVRSASQETIMGRLGTNYTQEHKALADVYDLIRVLTQKHQGGRTYLARLLEGAGSTEERKEK